MKGFAILLLTCTFFSFSANTLSAEKQVIELQPYVQKASRVGQLDFYRTYQYSFKSSGNLTHLNVDVGERFAEGDLLASVDTDDLNSELNRLLAEKAFVNSEVKRLSKLQKQNAVSASEVERLKSQSSQLKAGITRTKEFLSATSIIAPYNGVVVKRMIERGEWVAPGQSVLTVAPTDDNLVVVVGVQESELSQLDVGSEVVLTSKSSGREALGTVKVINATPEASSGLFKVYISVSDMNTASIGKLFSVEIRRDAGFAFKVPTSLVNIHFNQTATIEVLDANEQPQLSRFKVLGIEPEFVYLAADNRSKITLAK